MAAVLILYSKINKIKQKFHIYCLLIIQGLFKYLFINLNFIKSNSSISSTLNTSYEACFKLYNLLTIDKYCSM